MRKQLLYFSTFLIFHGQAQTGIWTGLDLSKKWSKHFQSSVGGEYRMELGNGFTKAYVNTQQVFPIVKGLDPFIAYRFSLVPNSNAGISPINESSLNRLGFGIKLNFLDLLNVGNGRMNLSWTIQQQYEFSAIKRTVSMMRNRVQWKYDIKNSIFTPFLSVEHFYRWNKDVVYTATDVMVIPGTVAFRYFIGTEFELKNNQSIEVCYGVRQKYDSGNLNGIIRLTFAKSLK